MHESTQAKDSKSVEFDEKNIANEDEFCEGNRRRDDRSLSIASDVQSKILASTMSYLLVKERPQSNSFLLDLVRNEICFKVDQAISVTETYDVLCEKYEVHPRRDICDRKRRLKMNQIRETYANHDLEPMKMFSARDCDEKYCSEFLDTIEVAKLLVSDIATEAIRSLNKMMHITYKPKISVPHQKICTEWIPIKDFTISEGLNLIQNYIEKCGYFYNDWKYTIFYKGYSDDTASATFHYEVLFSLPCRLYPIPQVTASLYFNIEVSNIIPDYCPIKVYFLIEGSRQKMNPQKFILHDNTFLRILEIKMKHFQTFTF
ncbi:hypothetical protein GWI33_008979 [Rhynchophorus ferrugineus]|uniref:Uncharacterized protein n=1 Tax=Rhynchophorus ferrugineus TaxID=354439 RepID=A0A834MDT1_RHYFE|nr:hypothetical protein GWI33_008979 [Rhynchophorus ferrugineus]